MALRVFLAGLFIWAAATIGIRLVGHHLLAPNRSFLVVILYLASFVLMALLARLILKRLGVPKNSWPALVTLLIVPTLLLDPFSCLFFATVFPNLGPTTAGIFGGWMLICCGGAVAGVWIKA